MNAINRRGYQDVPMTRRRAQLLAEYANKLADMLEAAPDNRDLAEWVQSKIDRAADQIQSAYHYLDQEDDDELEKAVGHKYTHRKRVGTDKRGRARYRYYYAEHQGGGISRASFEAGSAFKLTWKGRRGHFHIDRVEGDQVFITHDSRPNMEPVAISKGELRALLKRQHGKAEQEHVEKRRKEVEKIKSRNVKRGLGLALHRLRQAAAQAGATLPEQYQRKPKKTRAPVAETAREVEAQRDKVQGFKHLEKLKAYAAAKHRTKESFANSNLGGTGAKRTSQIVEYIDRASNTQLNREAIHTELSQSGEWHYLHKVAVDEVDAHTHGDVEPSGREDLTKPIVINHKGEVIDGRHRVMLARKRGITELPAYMPAALLYEKEIAEEGETPSEVETPRNQLTETAQQIIEEANQDHEERHEEHQEITKFELGEHTHTRTGQKLFTAKQKERVERDEYFRRLEIAKKHGGRYERRYVRGFVFKSAEDARAFALEVEGAAQEAPETSAETVTPHEDHPSADNFETMPEVESAPTQRLRGVLDALSESERLNTINPKDRKRPKEAKGADAKLITLVNELAEDQDPNERRFLKVMASMLQDVKKQYPRSAYERRESRKDRYATIREFIEKKLGVEPTATAPNLGEILSRPTTPSTRPASAYYGRATKKLVDQALSSEPTGFDPKRSGIDLPTKGDLREMLSQEQRLKRAKEDLVSTGAPNFLGQRNPIQDIMYALDRYLNGPYVELEQERIREMERGLKIALRDSKDEELEQVKDETARFWREWGGEYKRLQRELVTERTQGEALRNIRPLIPDHVLTPEINQLLDQMEQELDQRPVTGHDVARWIDTRDTHEATRDRQPKAQPTTPREQLTETAREVTPTRTAHTIVLDRLLEAKRSGNEAQESQVNEQLRPQLMSLLEKLEQGTLDDGERQALLSRYQELQTLTTGAAQELAQEIVSRLQGADNFETMPEVEAPEKGEAVQDERFEYGLELEALAKRAGLKYSEQGVTRSADARLVRDNEPRVMISAPQLQKVYPKLTQEQVNDFKARAIAYLKEFTGDDLTEDIQHTARSNQTRSRMIYKELDAAISHIINEVGRGGREERRATLQAVKMLAEWREDTQPPTPSPARDQLTETVREITAPSSPLNIDQANAQDTLTENRTRSAESKAADKALIESARELAKTSERGEEIKSALVDLMNAQQLKRYKRATGDMSARAEDMIEKRREARERLRSATSGEVINNFETMPEVEAQPKKQSGPDISRYKRALSLAKKGKRLDKLTNGRRSKASREADQALISIAQEILEKDLGDVEVRTIYRKPSTMWTREESLKVAIGAMAGELKTRQRALGMRGGAEQAQELRADAREKLIDAIQEHVDRFLPDEVIDARLDRDLARDARETAKQEAREAQEARLVQQKTFTPEIQSAIESLKSRHFATRGKSYPLETYLKTRKDGGIFKTTETPAELADRIAENLPDTLANLYDFGEDTLRALITKAINEGVEARETPAELKDRIGSVITKRAQDNAASQKAQITGEGQRKALIEMKRNIKTLSGDGHFNEYRRGGERSYMGLGAIEKTLDMSERLSDLYVDAIFRQALPPELERFKTPVARFEAKAADQVAGAFANKYETVGEIRDNISTITEQMKATIKSALDQTTDALVKRPTTLDLINQSYEKATERLNTDRQKNIENARALAQYTDDPQAHLAEIQELERQSDQAIAEQMEINREFARAYIHEASDLAERVLETTKGEVIDNVMSVKTPKHADKFTATVRGKANQKLMARIFNEVFEQVRREIGDEPIERGEKHPRNIANTVKKPSKTPAQFRGDIERADEEKRARKLAEREARRARRTQKSANHLIDYRAQLLQTIERIA